MENKDDDDDESWCRYQRAKAREKILFRHSQHILYWGLLT
jgi:hypothetical protein